MTAGAPYGVLRQALRRLCRLSEEEPLESQRARLATRLGRSLAEADFPRVVRFLGELCGVAFPDDGKELLAAARGNPRLLHEQIRRAFLDWLGAECAHGGTLVVLDDLQWSDSLSVELLDGALRELSGAPLLVLAFARPELHEVFPSLWPGQRLQVIPLRGLNRKACERLVQQVLPQQVAPEILARIVEQSAGNALFLEESIRPSAPFPPRRQPPRRRIQQHPSH